MKTLLLTLTLSLGVIGLSLAGPVRPVRSTTFTPPLPSPSGPPGDWMAAQGQWFMDPITGSTYPKTWEFHDDDNTLSIKGVVQMIFYDGTPASNIVAFTVMATVMNNLPSTYQPGVSSNSHLEVQSPPIPSYYGKMQGTRIVAEFAVANMAFLPSGQVPYYTDPVSGGAYYIEANNEHELAWYCWAPNNPLQLPAGNFQVPAWKVGNIPPGGSASVLMIFQISSLAGPAVMPMTDYRSSVIRYSLANQADIFYARHPSLKISHWLDTLLVDYGQQGIGLPFEEPEYVYASDVSVFFDQEMDFGDAPDTPYPTLLASGGARHIIMPGIFMGSLIDAEPDGQPNATATGDDGNNLADEDGVAFTSPLIPGLMASANVTCSVAGYLSAWVDFNLDGSWSGAGEQIFTMQPVSAGVNALAFQVPAKAGIGTTFARFRFTTRQVPITYTGLVDDGEVEDYQVLLEEEERIDFGDAWDSPTAPGYPTLLVNNGARHTIVSGVSLGAIIDWELDGQPDPNALGDDNNLPDDEDGVFIPSPLIAGASVNVQVTASTNGFLNAWIDWNSNGSWADPGEQVYWNVPLSAGPNNLALNVPIPPAIVSGGPHSRWRFTTYAPAAPSYTGQENDGEVEDYEVRLQVLDLGDAPAVYPTLLVSNGARHLIPSSYYLGALAPDLEQDGQPTPSASGDDGIGVDDEDGVTFSGLLIRGSNTTFKIVASTNGWLNAWIDFNQNGSWGDKGEQIATDVGLASGTNTLVVSVPALAAWGQTFGRFRFSSAMGLLPAGLAYDGEVEDYDFTIYQPKPTVILAITNITCNASNTVATIKWNGESPLVYETQYTDVLSTSMTWTAWGPYVSSSPYEQTNSISGQTSRFYRVSAPYTAP